MSTTDKEPGAVRAHPRFVEALRDLGLDELPGRVRRFPEGTRTAAEAAAAIARRVDVEPVRRELGGRKVTRARADVVREATGYAIGGVPPFGHATRTRVLADRSLLAHSVVWAAAWTPYTVFPMDPVTLVAHAGATPADVREAAGPAQ
ncbi:YbaK/EbsC family protein [Streptomyces aureocirculatus]|uniref:YbaK/EbsC family protein n=1 Tax=Streptomyces aureocirculatus TaxID=67275 RepID=UPI0004C9F3D7|nr:YbaK/EbsC family protein [Streptomyces aureocirculatus]